MAEASDEEILERFIEAYATPERGKKLWDQWMSVQNDSGKAIIEQMAEAAAEEDGVSIEIARGRLAAAKAVQDVGIDFAVKFLAKKDAAALKSSRALKPMEPGSKKRGK